MKKQIKNIATCCLAAIGILLSSCDAHKDFPDTAMKVGHILCTDGNVHSLEEVKSKKKEPIAVVFYINQSEEVEGNGYAVYLKDVSPTSFANSLGIIQGTSTSLTALDGNANTYSIYSTKDTSSPLAEEVFQLWRYGQSAYVPSVAQMRLLYSMKNVINPYIIACGGTPLPDKADECWYWTSTEVKGQASVKAWLYSLESGGILETPKILAHKARPIVTLNN
ncbi:MAG: DUF1566 domain-containing protein [Massilibacteroides sp.]|nr:DUF1566 domain-containing protein [Massilibacteroides sp.]